MTIAERRCEKEDAKSRRRAGLAVDVLAVADLDYEHNQAVILDAVNNPVNAAADAIALLATQFLAAGRPGIVTQRPDMLSYPLPELPLADGLKFPQR